MTCCVQLIPHANLRYREFQASLGAAELSCLLSSVGIFSEVGVRVLGGATFLTFEVDSLTDAQLRLLFGHSAALMLCVLTPEGLLRPLHRPEVDYLPSDLAEVLKYKGKTSATFTRLMLNVARAASDFAQADRPLTVLDPMCGKGTTAFVALQAGHHAVGLDIDRKDLKEAADYFSNYLQFHRLKHTLDQSSRTAGKDSVPTAVYAFADSREHYSAGDRRTLTLMQGDTATIGELMRKSPADLLVCDLPYGVQHAPQGGPKAEPFLKLLTRALPAWHQALKKGGAMALAFNTLTLKKDALIALTAQAGFTPLTEAPYHDFAHFVEQAVHRDVLVCRK